MKKSAIYAICGVVLLIAACFCGVQVFRSVYSPRAVMTATAAAETDVPEETEGAADVPDFEPDEMPASTAPAEAEDFPLPTEAPYISPVDFEALRSVNPDIYGWLEIENTNISYPIVQSPTDDTYYLDHNSDRKYSAGGAIFSESQYNSGDFADPVTILYGHHMQSGAMFGRLQQYYSDASFFADNQFITVYTPEAEMKYGVFAALPYSNDHILYYNDFTDSKVFDSFFDTLFNARDLSAHFNRDYAPEAGDRVLILSTCLAGNNTRRFLVMATLLA